MDRRRSSVAGAHMKPISACGARRGAILQRLLTSIGPFDEGLNAIFEIREEENSDRSSREAVSTIGYRVASKD